MNIFKIFFLFSNKFFFLNRKLNPKPTEADMYQLLKVNLKKNNKNIIQF